MQDFRQLCDELASAPNIAAKISILLTAATRAPSTHNSQPWVFRIQDAKLCVYLDPTIKMPESDSMRRYAHISIGFLLQHIAVLAFATGLRPIIKDGTDGSLATIWFTETEPDIAALPLAEALFTRRNRRGVFSQASIDSALLSRACGPSPYSPSTLPEARVHARTDRESLMTVAALVEKNMRRVYARNSFRAEMSRWIVPSDSRRLSGIPGYSLGIPTFVSWFLPLLIRFFNIGSTLGKLNAAAVLSACATFGVEAQESVAGWLATGFQASHTILTLHAAGVSTSIFVALIEYDDTREEADMLFGTAQQIQFHFVAGYFDQPVSWLTPRIPIAEKIRG